MRSASIRAAGIVWQVPAMASAQTTVHYDWLTQGDVSGRLTLINQDSGERSIHFEFNDRGRGLRWTSATGPAAAG